MKYILLITPIILLLAASSFSQTDSVLFFKKADFSYYKLKRVKYLNTGEIKMEKSINTLDDVTMIKFLTRDSVVLSKYGEKPVHTSLSLINDVNKYQFRLSPAWGAVIGFFGGALLGGGIGYLLEKNSKKNNLEGFATGILSICGALSGTVIGTLITWLIINYPTLDVFSIPDKDKKSKLIKFLRQN